VKKDRLHRLSEELKQHALEQNRSMIGNTYRVLVTGKDRKEGYLSGLTEGKIVLRFPSEDNALIGQFVDVQMKSATPFSLEGEFSQQSAVSSRQSADGGRQLAAKTQDNRTVRSQGHL